MLMALITLPCQLKFESNRRTYYKFCIIVFCSLGISQKSLRIFLSLIFCSPGDKMFATDFSFGAFLLLGYVKICLLCWLHCLLTV